MARGEIVSSWAAGALSSAAHAAAMGDMVAEHTAVKAIMVARVLRSLLAFFFMFDLPSCCMLIDASINIVQVYVAPAGLTSYLDDVLLCDEKRPVAEGLQIPQHVG